SCLKVICTSSPLPIGAYPLGEAFTTKHSLYQIKCRLRTKDLASTEITRTYPDLAHVHRATRLDFRFLDVSGLRASKGSIIQIQIKDMQSSIDSAGWIRWIVQIIPGDPPMTIARAHLVDPSVTRWYHCVTRCVRRAFLLGEGMHDRKSWIERRLEELAEIFSVAPAGTLGLPRERHAHARLRRL